MEIEDIQIYGDKVEITFVDDLLNPIMTLKIKKSEANKI